jgi:hypothetical protein
MDDHTGNLAETSTCTMLPSTLCGSLIRIRIRQRLWITCPPNPSSRPVGHSGITIAPLAPLLLAPIVVRLPLATGAAVRVSSCASVLMSLARHADLGHEPLGKLRVE